MDIRTIDEMRMPALWKLWVRALHDHSEAFGASYALAKAISPEEIQERLRQIGEGGGFILGAVEQDELIGMLNFTDCKVRNFGTKGTSVRFM